MSKHDKTDLLGETETLLKALVKEANERGSSADGEASDGSSPDFSERLKVVDVVAKFLIVKNRLVPPAKARSVFEELQHGLYGGEAGGRTGKASKGNGAASVLDVDLDS